MRGDWSQTADDQLSCGCRLSVRWKSEQVMAVSHGMLSKLFLVDETGNLLGDLYPNDWVRSVCPDVPWLYDTTDAG